MQRILLAATIAVLLVSGRSHAIAAVVISEILAQNDGGLRDAESDTPDWIELHNTGAASVNLDGWRLTDNPANLARWTFPATNIAPGGYLIVFASGKDRATNGTDLHANFELNEAGGYVALVDASSSIVHSFTYGNQRANVSFGIGSSNTVATVLNSNATFQWLVPNNGTLGTSWISNSFNASTWSNATAPLRYDTSLGIGIDFNDRENDTPVFTQNGFSSFVIGSVGGIVAAQSGAITRIYDGISFTLSNTSPSFGYDDRLRPAPLNGGGFTTEALLRDFVFSRDNSGSSGLDVHVAGLSPGQPYDVTIWSFDSSSGGTRVSDWALTGVLVTNNYTFNGSVAPTTDTQYRFTFRTTANASGRILVSGRRDVTSVGAGGAPDVSVFLNALRIVPTNGMATTSGNLAALAGVNGSVYARSQFAVSTPSDYESLRLRVRYDDGFVAYLNGTEIARRNAPGVPAFDSTATATNDANAFEEIVLPGAASLLVPGANVFAVQALNVSAGDGDFFFQPELIAVRMVDLPGRYLATPTPGSDNEAGYLGLVADTKFSVDRGFYESPFALSLSCETPGATIYFTTNGSPPSPTNGTAFTAPLTITGHSFVRAAAFYPNFIPSDIDTHTYIFLRDVLRQSNNIPNYPNPWAQGSYPADYEMDSTVVNHATYGTTLSNDLRSIPVLSIVTEHDGLWGATRGIYTHATSTHDLDLGQDWERAASAELILPDGANGTSGFAVNCAIRMQGNASRDNARTPKHSFRMLFKSGYGPTKLAYNWFPGPVNEFDNIILRAAGFVDGWPSRYSDTSFFQSSATGETFRGQRYRPESSSYLRDGWAKEAHRDMGWLASRGTWVHLYINGLYWGIYNPVERLDSTFVAEHIGGLESDWDVLVGDDTVFNAAVADGSKDDWNAMLAVVNAGVASEAAYQAVAQLVDIDSLIDYMLLHIYIEAEDWPHHNWYAAHRRANPTNGLPATKWTFLTWDQELSLDRQVRRDRVVVGDGGNQVDSPARVYSRLRNWPEFRVRFGDRVHKHLFNGGALTPSNNVARLMSLASVITNALVGESARWGDAREFTIGSNPGTGVTFTRDEWWVPELQKLATNFLWTLAETNLVRLRANSLYPSIGAPAFSQFGGAVSNGFALVITHTNVSGTIYYTTDDSDPRVYSSGAVAGSAVAYSSPIAINTLTLVRARVLIGSTWSALLEATFFPPQDLSKLALTEIMYNPPSVGFTNSDEFEFIELKNYGTNTLNLSGLTFTNGFQFTFPNGTMLAPGQFFVMVRNAAAFVSKYPGVSFQGIYSGRLDNGGETLTLAHALGSTIFSVTYNDTAPWPSAADSYGFSLVPVNPGLSQAPDDGATWRASALRGGSPGADDPASSIAPILINEVLTHTTAPAFDRIELFNPTSTNVDIGGWFLSDNHDLAKKFRLTNGTVIAAGGYLTFDESQFNSTPGLGTSFSLSSSGEQLYLFSGDANTNLTGYSHGFEFGGAQNGVSFGRYVNSVGEEQFPAQLATTFGSANAGPRIGPVVINEIHYHPAPGRDEFVELKNISTTNVALFDPAFPTNTWQLDGVTFAFPSSITLPPNGLLVLVRTNVNYFRAKYAVPANVPVLAYAGGLQQSGERLDLTRPDAPDTNGVSRISVDTVRYNDKVPWPPAADGSGPSLQRIAGAQYADDPINWQAATPTPGGENSALDSDSDGISDAWEIATGTDPFVADSNNDDDGDGFTNLQEYFAGTHPGESGSYLQMNVSVNAAAVQLQFNATSNRNYRVQFQDALNSLDWLPFTNVSSAPENRTISINDPRTNSSRFYRIATP